MIHIQVFYQAVAYKYKFSDYSEFRGDNATPYYHPYDNANLEARVFLTNEGNDTLTISNNFTTQYISDMGAGDDKVEYTANGTASPPIATGSYFDGGVGSDTLRGSAVADHYGWNSTNYNDSIKPTNASILDSAGNSTNIASADSSYFNNFETISANTGQDSFYIGGDPGNNITLQGDAGNDSFQFNYAFSSSINAEGGANNDTFTISNSQYTGILEIDGGLNDDTLEGSSDFRPLWMESC